MLDCPIWSFLECDHFTVKQVLEYLHFPAVTHVLLSCREDAGRAQAWLSWFEYFLVFDALHEKHCLGRLTPG